jgi:hypothetical protein
MWEPTRLLIFELESGVMAPFVRESFSFSPGVPIYVAPILAFFGRAGVSVHFL